MKKTYKEKRMDAIELEWNRERFRAKLEHHKHSKAAVEAFKRPLFGGMLNKKVDA